MKANNGSDRGRYATALLASTWVICAGVAVCGLIVLTSADDETALRVVMVTVGTALLLFVLSWVLRDRRTNGSDITNIVWLAHRQKARSAVYYKPRVLRDSHVEVPIENGPPTVERLREISQNVKTWVPSRTRSASHRKSARQG
jgi:hypothetical protein